MLQGATRIATTAATIAAEGVRANPYIVKEIRFQDKSVPTIKAKVVKQQVFDKDLMSDVIDAMTYPVDSGTAAYVGRNLGAVEFAVGAENIFNDTGTVPVQVVAIVDRMAASIDGADIVPGDIVVLSAGKSVPGDCLVLESSFGFGEQVVVPGSSPERRERAGILFKSLIPQRFLANRYALAPAARQRVGACIKT